MLNRESTPKYQAAADALRSEIVAGTWRPGEQIPGERVLADRFRVSYMTLRHAISTLVDSGELVRVLSKGTFVADKTPLVETSLRPMTLLFPADPEDLDPHYFPEILAAFMTKMTSRGVTVNCRDYQTADTPGVIDNASAVACLMLTRDHFDLIERLRDRGMLVVAINQYRGRRTIPCVRIDEAAGVMEAVSYLVSFGHTKIGFVRGPSSDLGAQIRQRGFRDAVKKLGLTETVEVGEGFTVAAGYSASTQLLQSPDRPTAILCASDLAAIGALRAAGDLGISVPDSLSVIGVGDFPAAHHVHPRLTTVCQPRSVLGAMAAEVLIELAEDKNVGNRVIEAKLIVRESVAQCKSETRSLAAVG